MKVRGGIGLAVAALCLTASAATADLDRPLTVSPGDTAGIAAAPAGCPTFSWAGVGEASRYEIVVFEMKAAEVAAAAPGRRPTLAVILPGAASSWTPSADRCLAGETAYVWFVRALGLDDQVSDWSRGAMFRTPMATPANELRETIVRLVGEVLRVQTTGVPAQPASRSPRLRLPTASKAPSTRATSTTPPRQPAPAEAAFRAEINDEVGAVTYGVYGISDSDADESSGVVGYVSAEEGDVRGVSGFSHSSEGTGVYGESTAPSGGVGVLGVDSPDSTIGHSAGVVGLTDNSNGYGGFFWHYADGSALAVGNPEVVPFDLKFTVAADGDVWAAGLLSLEGDIEMSGGSVVAFSPTDSPPSCDGPREGAIYYDTTEAWLCVCTKEGASAYEWRRADDKTAGC